MSVQVKHRRESAAFLATFVGAQGELIVDTTNNRVQVHDGVTPGGWPAAKLAEIPTSATLGAATAGANTNITSLSGLTTPLSLTQGGTGASTTATGTGQLVFSTSPTLTSPALGTPSAINLANASALPAVALPARVGDVTSPAGSATYTLATVNTAPGTVGSSTAIPVLTTNAKGLVTAQTTAAVVAPAGTLTGSTLAATVTASSLASVGALVAGAVPTTLLTGALQAAQQPAHAGDVTNAAGSLTLTIGANVVTNAKAAQMAAGTLKGNNTGATANASDLTAAQAAAMLPAVVGDAGSGGAQGLVPTPPAGSAASNLVLGASGGFVGRMAGFRNRLRNANFAINQRGVSGTVTLAAGAYGHDGAKGGAAGCAYTFATSGIDTVLTITAGSLILPIESTMIEGGVYTVSQAGTAQARVWQGTGTSGSGSYAAAPFSTSSLSAATQTNVEFSTGTVSRAQLEPGTIATALERRPFATEQNLCFRYFVSFIAASYIRFGLGYADTTTTAQFMFYLPGALRAAPTVTMANMTLNGVATGVNNVAGSTANLVNISATGSGLTVGQIYQLYVAPSTTGTLFFAAEI